ncbi:MAG: hypothetical protein EAX95_13340 [Candidatus Thorarchaeota archaeon]|nr:hypothetical protein [Candidatus Thorarchaeota archaeon]
MSSILWLLMEFGKGLAVGVVVAAFLLAILRRKVVRYEEDQIRKARLQREKEIEALFLELLELSPITDVPIEPNGELIH